MTNRLLQSSVAGAVLVLANMPAAACPGQGAVPSTAAAPLVRIVATNDGFAIVAKTDVPVAPHITVPLGASVTFDRDAFEGSTRRFARARQ
jgi:hypothetical protein